jgi:hypothetical protein
MVKRRAKAAIASGGQNLAAVRYKLVSEIAVQVSFLGARLSLQPWGWRARLTQAQPARPPQQERVVSEASERVDRAAKKGLGVADSLEDELKVRGFRRSETKK